MHRLASADGGTIGQEEKEGKKRNSFLFVFSSGLGSTLTKWTS